MQIEQIAIPGAAELDALFAELGKEMATVIGTEAIGASADMLADAWRRGAPFDPNSGVKSWTLKSGETRSRDYGHLNQNIRVGAVSPRGADQLVFKVTTGNAFWGYFRELGTVNQPARPWARPILHSLKGALVQVQIETARAGIERVVGSGITRSSGRNG